ncbi:uncharacterized protein LOC127878446 [Dreissena polymorpha]|uniref:uncharacterized protein LOC127878446 n=1 Tax=Dreissena polymorpha TaxID=45954 RepID=UPI0022656CCD|nr:uncharacterized protein LOC127878446 [Dreissena polymorpha]
MATGDLGNNIRKLRKRLKEMKYVEEIDITGVSEGAPNAFLPVYHYAFTSFSPAVAELILGKDIELYGKSDARFMEAIYKVLRDIFAYKPPITKEQFFGKGFVERKIIMCTEILDLVQKKQSQLNPGPKKTTMKTSVRPKSAPEGRLSQGVSKRKSLTQNQQVINELITPAESQPVRHVSQGTSHTVPVRHVAETNNSSERSSFESVGSYRSDQQPTEVVSKVTFSSPREVHMYSPESSASGQGLVSDRFQFNSCFNTPSIKRACLNSVEVISMPRNHDTQEPSILEIQAPSHDSILNGPVASQQDQLLEVTSQVSGLQETVTKLVTSMHTQMELMQKSGLLGDSSGNKNINSSSNNSSIQLEKVLSQLSTLAARMTLLENRVSIIESKIELTSQNIDDLNLDTGSRAGAPNTQIQPSGKSNPVNSIHVPDSHLLADSNQSEIATWTSKSLKSLDPPEMRPLFDGPGSSFAEELRLMPTSKRVDSLKSTEMALIFSPIRKLQNVFEGQLMSGNEDTFVALETEDDARRSSTPTFRETFEDESTLKFNCSDVNTKATAVRINNMLKETMKEINKMKAPEEVQAQQFI